MTTSGRVIIALLLTGLLCIGIGVTLGAQKRNCTKMDAPGCAQQWKPVPTPSPNTPPKDNR